MVYRGRLGDELDAVAVGRKGLDIAHAIQVSLAEPGVYAETDTASPYPAIAGFDKITLRVDNLYGVSGTDLTYGTLTLAASYRVGQSDQFVNNPPTPGNSLLLSVGNLNNVTVPRLAENGGIPGKFTFNLDKPIPFWATDLRLHLYYKKPGWPNGTLAVGYKDISEPTPIGIINLMDGTCSGSGPDSNFRHALEARNYAITSAISPDWVIANDFVQPRLLPNEVAKKYILTDYYFFWDMEASVNVRLDAADNYAHYPKSAASYYGQSVKNQYDYQYNAACASSAPCNIRCVPSFFERYGHMLRSVVYALSDGCTVADYFN